MKYKIEKGETLDKLLAFKVKMNECRDKALILSKELGSDRFAFIQSHVGGIGAIKFEENPGDNWRSIGGKYYGLYMPKSSAKYKKQNSDMLEKIEALPKVRKSEAADIIDFKMEMVGSSLYTCPHITIGDDFALMDVRDDSAYIPPFPVTEILGSEYLRLLAEIEAKLEEA